MRLFSDVTSRIDDAYLARAAVLALRGAGRTWPNPVVGCVVVRDGEIVGEGFHPRAGEPHAEIFALAQARERARGADAYVTLEPCNHHGRTPPCVDALIEAGVASVTIGMTDPNPVAAGGLERLRTAGIAVNVVADQAPFAEITLGWLKRMRTGLPLVTAKVGQTLDAKVAFQPGLRARITGPSGAEVTARLRDASDAVLVSAATVIADDPALTVRTISGELAEHQPLRVVLVRETVPHLDTRIFAEPVAPTLLLASDRVDEAVLTTMPEHVFVERWSAAEGVAGALRALAARGIGELLVEPGPRLLSALWDAGLVDRLVTVSAGGMAGEDAPVLYRGLGDWQGDSLLRRMSPFEAGIVGDVSVTVWRPSDAAAE